MIFVGICGPSNSGKSTLCETLTREYNASWIELDHYLRDIEDIPFIRKYRNWELPQNYRFDAVIQDLKSLKSKKSIKHPIYNFKEGKIKGYKVIIPKEIVFIEGFYLFSDKNLRDFLDIKIYLDIPIKEVLKRREYTEEEWDWSKRDYVEKVYVPMFRKYGEIQRKYADFIIDAIEKQQEISNRTKGIISAYLMKNSQ